MPAPVVSTTEHLDPAHVLRRHARNRVTFALAAVAVALALVIVFQRQAQHAAEAASVRRTGWWAAGLALWILGFPAGLSHYHYRRWRTGAPAPTTPRARLVMVGLALGPPVLCILGLHFYASIARGSTGEALFATALSLLLVGGLIRWTRALSPQRSARQRRALQLVLIAAPLLGLLRIALSLLQR